MVTILLSLQLLAVCGLVAERIYWYWHVPEIAAVPPRQGHDTIRVRLLNEDDTEKCELNIHDGVWRNKFRYAGEIWRRSIMADDGVYTFKVKP